MKITIEKTKGGRHISHEITIDTSKCRDVDEIKETLSIALSFDGCSLGVVSQVFGFDPSKIDNVLNESLT